MADQASSNPSGSPSDAPAPAPPGNGPADGPQGTLDFTPPAEALERELVAV